MSIAEKIEEYVGLRDFLSDERKKFKDLESKIKSDMEVLETAILDQQRELGVTSLSTKLYTAFQTEKTFVRMANWDDFIDYVRSTNNFQMIEKRPAKLACLEVLENEGITPEDIGLNMTSEICVQVRKK